MMTEAEFIAELAEQAHKPAVPTIVYLPDGRAWLFSESSLVSKDVSDENRPVPTPAHIRQSVTLQTVDSLVDYVVAFRMPSTMLFADHNANKIVAVLDYHAAGVGSPPRELLTDAPPATLPMADRLLHRATMALPFSEEWKAWLAIDKAWMDQLAFARFLEQNAADIEAPSGADLIDVVRDINAVRSVSFKKAVRTATDNESFEYSDDTKATTKNGTVEIPNKFLLRIPVYFGGATYSLAAFLRWKLTGNELSLGISLHRAEHVRQAVFREIVDDIAARTERPAVLGTL